MRDSMASSPIINHAPRGRLSGSRGLVVLLILGLLTWAASRPASAGVPFAPGDLVVGLGSSLDGSSEGEVRHFSPAGNLLETLFTTSGSFEETGMCVDGAKNLYTTNFEGHSVS